MGRTQGKPKELYLELLLGRVMLSRNPARALGAQAEPRVDADAMAGWVTHSDAALLFCFALLRKKKHVFFSPC